MCVAKNPYRFFTNSLYILCKQDMEVIFYELFEGKKRPPL